MQSKMQYSFFLSRWVCILYLLSYGQNEPIAFLSRLQQTQKIILAAIKVAHLFFYFILIDNYKFMSILLAVYSKIYNYSVHVI